MLNKTSVFLITHLLLLIAISSLRFFGLASDVVLIAAVAVLSLEVVYIAIFTRSISKKSACVLKEMKQEMTQLREEAVEAAKVHRALIYTGHQIKTIQGDLDLLKKRSEFKSVNGHRRVHPIISHS